MESINPSVEYAPIDVLGNEMLYARAARGYINNRTRAIFMARTY
jgi:hypothetical protein